MGIGLDRLVMLIKQIDDIRLLRSSDPHVARQMLTLDPYEPVSNQPATHRDMSICIADQLHSWATTSRDRRRSWSASCTMCPTRRPPLLVRSRNNRCRLTSAAG
jgi:hypothetical protein